MNTMTFTSDQLCALDDFAVLHIKGPEARSFMQAQLTNAVDALSSEQAVLAGFCQAKGRLQATMIVYADPVDAQNLYAILPRSIAETVRKRISMFLLRAKAELILSDLRVFGISQGAPTSAFALPATSYAVQQGPLGTLIAAPSHNETARAWLICEADKAPPASADASQWSTADMYAGLAWIQESTYEAFLPQDINLDIIGGVNFKKGCFPGQEVVARLHYRTTAKRRAALGVISSDQALDLLAGQDIFDAAQPERPFGRIINTAYDAIWQRQVLLMEVLIDGLEQKTLCTASEMGKTIQNMALPYGWEIAKY